tara:strand:+ start:8826 stop:9152 length:327 start_codon:yes stop_codon:yes gene_type:complete
MKEEFFDKLARVSKAHAAAEADKCHLMEYRKTLKSLLMIEAETSDAKMPVAKQERYAYAHPKYVELLEGLKVAIERAVRFRHQFTVMNMEFEAERSKNARARAEAGLR